MKLHANRFGKGKTFLILHGFLGMGDNWKTIGGKIAEFGYQVHLIDQRNHGRSPHSEDFSYDLLIADLKQYCDDYQLTNIILLGHSMGGKTAMHFACTFPDLVEKLVIADISPKYYPQHHQDILDGLQALNFNAITSRREADKELSGYVQDPGVRLFLLKNLKRLDQQRFGLRINLLSLSKNVNEIGKKLSEEAVFKGKTLFLKGENSNYIKREDHALIRHHFPNAHIETINKAGHWLHADNPLEFLEKLRDFIK